MNLTAKIVLACAGTDCHHLEIDAVIDRWMVRDVIAVNDHLVLVSDGMIIVLKNMIERHKSTWYDVTRWVRGGDYTQARTGLMNMVLFEPHIIVDLSHPGSYEPLIAAIAPACPTEPQHNRRSL